MINANKDKSLDTIGEFLSHFFSKLQKTNASVRPELFNIFSECVLNNSFHSLIDKIRYGNLNEAEKGALESIQLTDFNELSNKLQSVSKEKLEKLISNWIDYFLLLNIIHSLKDLCID